MAMQSCASCCVDFIHWLTSGINQNLWSLLTSAMLSFDNISSMCRPCNYLLPSTVFTMGGSIPQELIQEWGTFPQAHKSHTPSCLWTYGIIHSCYTALVQWGLLQSVYIIHCQQKSATWYTCTTITFIQVWQTCPHIIIIMWPHIFPHTLYLPSPLDFHTHGSPPSLLVLV